MFIINSFLLTRFNVFCVCVLYINTGETVFQHILFPWTDIWKYTFSHNAFRSLYTTKLCMCAKSLQLCLTLCDPMDCSQPGFFVHGILQERILEWVSVSSSRESSWPRDQKWVSALRADSLTIEPWVSMLIYFNNLNLT